MFCGCFFCYSAVIFGEDVICLIGRKLLSFIFFVLTFACIVHLVFFLKALTSIIITLLLFIT